MEQLAGAFYLTVLGLACIAAAPLFLFQKHDCAAPLLLSLGLSILIIGLAGLKGVSL